MSARYAPACRTPRLLAALAAVVRAHPMLRVGIAGEATSAARYTYLPRVDLSEHVVVVATHCASEAALNEDVARIQARQHNARWEDTHAKAPWRVTVVRDEGRDCEDVIFAFHHALLDGLSGRRFHEHLLAALDAAPDEGTPILAFPDPPVLPAPQEDAVPFTLGPLYVASVLWDEFAPAILKPAPAAVWGGARISFALPYVTRLRPVDIPPAQARVVLAACRQHDTTLTGLLHALAFAYFTAALPADAVPGFSGATPMGLHKHTRDDMHPDALRVLICSTDHAFSLADVVAMRAALAGDTLSAAIWAVAARIRGQLAARSGSLPHNDLAALMRHVGDWTRFHTRRDGTRRPSSWEVSNVGVVAAAGNTVKVSRVLFANGAMVTGAPVSINAASTADGHLALGLAWQEGVVGDDLVKGLGRMLEGMGRFCEGGAWTDVRQYTSS